MPRLHHALDLVVLALVQGDAPGGTPAGAVRQLHAAGSRYAVRTAVRVPEAHAGLQCGNILRRQRKLHRKGIGFIHMACRRQQAVRQLAVVGQQHESRCMFVQPPAGKQPRPQARQLRREQIQHRRLPCQPVLGSTDHSVRLVEHDVGVRSVHDGFAPEHDRVRVRLHRAIAPSGRHPVDCYLSAADGTKRFAPACLATQAQEFVQSHGFPHLLPLRCTYFTIRRRFCKYLLWNLSAQFLRAAGQSCSLRILPA